MPQYTYLCLTCGKEFTSIEKVGTKFAYCPSCKNIGKREGIELCSPAQIESGVGGVSRPKYGTRERE